jgi:GTP cyclohydrolase II
VAKGESELTRKKPENRLQFANIPGMKASVTCKTSARIPTRYGDFQLHYYTNTLDDKEHLALCRGDVAGAAEVLVRIHSECFTGDVMGSLRCDCGEQLRRSMEMVAAAGVGVVLYLRQEGRGIGLLSKLQAYNLQDQGYDTVDANLMLGHAADERDYTLAACMLEDMGVKAVRLITNNPLKIHALEAAGIRISERVPLAVTANAENKHYLLTKARRMQHLLPDAAAPASSDHSHEPQRTN